MKFCIVNTRRCEILIWEAKYFACFSRFLPVKKLFQKMDHIEKSNPLPTPNPHSDLSLSLSLPICLSLSLYLSCSGVIRFKIFVLKHSIFFEDISNFNKWKSLIIDKKCWTLRNAMLREMVILLPKL